MIRVVSYSETTSSPRVYFTLLSTVGLNDCGAHTFEYIVVIRRPAQHNDEVVIRVHPDDIAARASRRERDSRVARPPLQPPQVTVIILDRAGRGSQLDPLFRDELFAVPFPAAQIQISESRHVTRVDEQAAAPMPATADRNNLLTSDFDFGIAITIPLPAL